MSSKRSRWRRGSAGTTVLAGIAFATAGAAIAQNNPSSDSFARLDTDRNGFLSETELNADTSLRGNFATMDRNRDRQISSGEFTAANATTFRGGPMTFDALDTDRNGRLSSSELSAAPGESRPLDTFDSNRDGQVSRDEFDRGAPTSSPGMDERRSKSPDASGTSTGSQSGKESQRGETGQEKSRPVP